MFEYDMADGRKISLELVGDLPAGDFLEMAKFSGHEANFFILSKATTAETVEYLKTVKLREIKKLISAWNEASDEDMD